MSKIKRISNLREMRDTKTWAMEGCESLAEEEIEMRATISLKIQPKATINFPQFVLLFFIRVTF